jgi:hypothetical protein
LEAAVELEITVRRPVRMMGVMRQTELVSLMAHIGARLR